MAIRHVAALSLALNVLNVLIGYMLFLRFVKRETGGML